MSDDKGAMGKYVPHDKRKSTSKLNAAKARQIRAEKLAAEREQIEQIHAEFEEFKQAKANKKLEPEPVLTQPPANDNIDSTSESSSEEEVIVLKHASKAKKPAKVKTKPTREIKQESAPANHDQLNEKLNALYDKLEKMTSTQTQPKEQKPDKPIPVQQKQSLLQFGLGSAAAPKTSVKKLSEFEYRYDSLLKF